ncbi:MAG: hypothetical protein FWE70_00490, partial [Oscillospiraceae bacterium]|nr:hypothetical protein [Oscillospiraceae bacterium]
MVEPPVMSAEEAAAALGRMESSIKGKSARMNELLGLTSSQRACVAAEDAEGLLALVEQKGRAMAEIDGMDLEFLGCFQSLKGYLGVSSLEGMTAEALEAKGLDAAVMRGVKAHVASTANAIKELQAMDSE